MAINFPASPAEGDLWPLVDPKWQADANGRWRRLTTSGGTGGGGGGGRIRFTDTMQYYVRPDGSDANDGLTDTSGGAWLTAQHAWDYLATSVDFGGQTVYVNFGAATYARIDDFPGKQFVGGGVLRLVNPGAAGDVVLASSISCFNCQNPNTTAILLDNITFLAEAGANLWIQASNANRIIVRNPTFIDNSANAGFLGMFFQNCALLDLREVLGLDGGGNVAYCYLALDANANCVWQQDGVEMVLTNTPTTSVGFIAADLGSSLQAYAMNFSGASAGPVALVDSCASIYTGGGGNRYFPGDADPVLTNGGVYE